MAALAFTLIVSVVTGVLCFVLILVVLQLWLLTATLNAYLGGDDAAVWPALATTPTLRRPPDRRWHR